MSNDNGAQAWLDAITPKPDLDPNAQVHVDARLAAAGWLGQPFVGAVAVTRGDGTAHQQHIRLAHARAEVEQALLERNRLGSDIGNPPLPMQQATYLAALARLQALEAASAP
jgi:hypothetical protein